MLFLRIYGLADSLTEVGRGLEDQGEARSVALAPAVRDGYALLTAEVQPDAADAVLDVLVRGGVPREDIALARLDEITPVASGHTRTSLIWADMVGLARANARPIARYIVFMTAAGLIAAFGVIEANAVLIVGAMAVSPDLLPITAACVGLVGRNGWLVQHALATLAVGLAATCVAAGALAGTLDLLSILPSGFEVGESALSGLASVNDATIVVAFVAGVAGMLALETRASAAVGVAISITTIPAAAYLGVAAAVGESDKAWGALAVLAVNVAMLLAGGTLTLAIQRRLAQRAPTY